MIKAYYNLAKPGIIYGNAITAIAGFFLAVWVYANRPVSWWLLLAMLVGISFVIGCGAVLNNLLDRDIDVLMQRTKNRDLVQGRIKTKPALVYATVLGLIGFGILFLYTNVLTLSMAAIGAIFYVCFYTFAKRKSVHGTLVGSISGAVPPLVGYCAFSMRFDAAALLLFLILVFWQMAHFYAIGIYRHDDYAAANLPILPVKKGFHAAKIAINSYIIAFIIVVLSLNFIAKLSYIYLIITTACGLYWLIFGLNGLKQKNNDRIWARKMFFISLLALTAWSLAIILNVAVNKLF